MISEWFSDEELISQFRMHFNESERDNIDFKALLGQLEVIDEDTREVKIKDRTFRFSMEFCNVEEVLE